MVDAELAEVWGDVREELRASVLESTYDLWLADLLPAALRGDVLYLTAPASTIAWVERRYARLIAIAAGRQLPGLRMVEILPAGDRCPETGGAEPPQTTTLNPDHTFGRFVIGAGTRLAHAAALAAAEAPGEAYNPLFLYGPPGLGKTHLLGAIGNYVVANNPSMSVLYTTAEKFTSEFVGALQTHGLDAFKERHRRLDVLLVDDVQSLAGRERTADELFHTFNALHEAGSQIVLSSDRAPSDLEPLADRLRDRFEWGLLAELEPPDLPTRRTILRRLAHETELALADQGTLEAIASATSGNVRQLQGALTRVVALSSLQGAPIDRDIAASALGIDKATLPAPGELTPASIGEVVARRFGCDPAQLTGASRTPAVVRARHVAFLLCRELTGLSLPRIGAAFDRDHSTVLQAIRKIERLLDADHDLLRVVDGARAELTAKRPSTRGDRGRCENRSSTNNRSPQEEPPLLAPINSNQHPQSLPGT